MSFRLSCLWSWSYVPFIVTVGHDRTRTAVKHCFSKGALPQEDTDPHLYPFFQESGVFAGLLLGFFQVWLSWGGVTPPCQTALGKMRAARFFVFPHIKTPVPFFGRLRFKLRFQAEAPAVTGCTATPHIPCILSSVVPSSKPYESYSLNSLKRVMPEII